MLVRVNITCPKCGEEIETETEVDIEPCMRNEGFLWERPLITLYWHLSVFLRCSLSIISLRHSFT